MGFRPVLGYINKFLYELETNGALSAFLKVSRFIEFRIRRLRNYANRHDLEESHNDLQVFKYKHGYGTQDSEMEGGAVNRLRNVADKEYVYRNEDFLPTKEPVTTSRLPDNVSVTIIIPVYMDSARTRLCIESVLKSKSETPWKLIIVNDHSPEAELVAYLDTLIQGPSLQIINNLTNLGFIVSVNMGISLCNDDVVLLNSDTEVADDWIDRLVYHAYASEKVGTVTPFSNNATICSYPVIPGTNELPKGENTNRMNISFKLANSGRSVEIPTAVGSCMYMRRDCIEDTGLFDSQIFGKGYGEETDFCMRASSKGWRHLLAVDTFVYHSGEASFKTNSIAGKERALKIIQSRYKHYNLMISKHVQHDPARPFRIAATAARYKTNGKPVVLLITHELGGGINRHIEDLYRMLSEKAIFLILKPFKAKDSADDLVLFSPDKSVAFGITFNSEKDVDFLLDFLRSCGVSRVHIHHLLGIGIDVRNLVRQLDVPFDFTVHDYYTICPQIQLITKDGTYCGEYGNSECAKCLSERPAYGSRDILWWRLTHRWLYTDADRVICPSYDVIKRIEQYQPAGKTLLVPHDRFYRNNTVKDKMPDISKPLRIALIGVLSLHKGLSTVLSCIEYSNRMSIPIEFHIIGYIYIPMKIKAKNVFVYGRYNDEDLLRLLETIQPHVVWFPAQWPETYSYTLSAAMESSLPIIAPNIGAFPERLDGRPSTWIVEWNQPADCMVSLFGKIHNELSVGNKKIKVLNNKGLAGN